MASVTTWDDAPAVAAHLAVVANELSELLARDPADLEATASLATYQSVRRGAWALADVAQQLADKLQGVTDEAAAFRHRVAGAM